VDQPWGDDVKAGIDLILRRLTEDEYSHVGSWPALRVNQFKHVGMEVETIHQSIAPEADYDAWKDYDTIYIYHDMAAFPDRNIVNVYDIGLERSAWFFERLIWPKHDHIKFVSLDYKMIPYGNRCAYKAPRPATSEYWKRVDWPKVQQRCDGVTEWVLDPGFTYARGKMRHLVVGDSHAHSAYTPGSMVLRKDARALKGFLKKGVVNEITSAGYDLSEIDSFSAYHGSIDIRHHLCREPDPQVATRTLVRGYVEELKKLDGRPIELVVPLPIEDETRVVPHMGWYKGAPFYGTQAERKVLRDIFEEELREGAAKNKGWTIYKWPQAWYDMDGIEYMRTYMERPRSVHLAWKYYRWDLVKDEPNSLHGQAKAATLLEF